jgi:tRNA pseudouridine38-40 synthase
LLVKFIAFLNNINGSILSELLLLLIKYRQLSDRYFIRLSFLGTNYHGWQTQENANSVQSVLCDALSVMLKERIIITGAGRTDAGVHAREFYAHFDSNYLDEKQRKELVFHLNGYLPFDISVQEIIPVLPGSHARFSAVSRTYQYIISLTKDPFSSGFAFHYSVPLDLQKMNEGASIIKSCRDFTSFAKLPAETKTNICLISEIFWEKNGNLLLFNITANRFLRNMVRAIVGTLLDLGRGKNDLNGLNEIIETKNRSSAGASVPACGLYLTSIQYPENIFYHVL